MNNQSLLDASFRSKSTDAAVVKRDAAAEEGDQQEANPVYPRLLEPAGQAETEQRAERARYIRQRDALIALTGDRALGGEDLTAALRRITEAGAAILKVARVSVWRYNRDRTAIECLDLYERQSGRHRAGMELSAAAYPAYFKALAESDVIAADDAHRDARTCEFSENYLRPLGIASMLDAPIHLGGAASGVLCHEHVGEPRRWKADEETFAVALANLAALALQGAERKRADEELGNSRQLVEGILNTIPVRVFWKDRDLTYLGCNTVFARDAGYADPADIVGKNDYQMVWRDQAELYRSDDRRVIESGTAKVLIEEPQTTPEMTTITLLTSKMPLRNADGEISGVLGSYIDISERKRAEDALTESRGQLEAIFNAAADGILLVEIDSMSFRSANSSICRMLGYNQKELLSLRLSDIHPKEDLSHVLYEFERQARGDAVIVADVPMKRKDGHVFFADINSATVTMDGKKYVLGIIRDTTERKRSEEAMLRAVGALKAISHCNSALIHAEDEAGLLNEICRIVVVIAGYRLAWVGFAEHDARKTIRRAAHFGCPAGFMKQDENTWDDTASGHGPAGTAIRTGEAQIVSDVHTDMRYESWRDNAINLGYRSVLCLPLAFGGMILGALCIYASDRDAFGMEETRLLSGLANELAFGIVTLRRRTEQNQSAERLRRGMESTIEALAGTLELRDAYTAGHQRRVAELAARIAAELGCSEDETHGIHLAATVHDLGKIQVPAEFLSKPTRLTELEFELVKTHSRAGYDLLKDIDFPWPIAEIVYQHHERLDGSGYPRRLRDEEILKGARIIAVADTIEAMSSHRPYRPGLGIDAALAEIVKNRGKLYDSAVVDACIRLFREKHFVFSA